MTMRPEDVQATRFREGWRGYDEDEVDDFMSRVGHALQVLANERDEAASRADELAKDAQEVRESERLLRRTLLTAERTAEETVQRAEAEAERIRSEARAEAERLRIDAHDRARREVQRAGETADRISRSMQEFRKFRDEYQAHIRDVISEQLAALDLVGELPDMPDHVAEFEHLEFSRPDGPRGDQAGHGDRAGQDESGDAGAQGTRSVHDPDAATDGSSASEENDAAPSVLDLDDLERSAAPDRGSLGERDATDDSGETGTVTDDVHDIHDVHDVQSQTQT